MTPYQGGCLCGSVRYEGQEEPIHTFYCHCTDCQKETGGPFATKIYIHRKSVTIDGTMASYDVVGDSGKTVTRKFCVSCGCPIVTEFEDEPEHVCIKAGSLDESGWLRPEFHLYMSSKQPWYTISDSLPQYSGDFEW